MTAAISASITRASPASNRPTRVMRANTGTLKMPIATIAVTSPGPYTAVSMMAESSAGNANAKSEKRITSSSTQPRRAAASSIGSTPTSCWIRSLRRFRAFGTSDL